jgi:hypothetical protein
MELFLDMKKLESKTKKSLVLVTGLLVVALAATFALTMIATVEEANALPAETNKTKVSVCVWKVDNDGARMVCHPA